MTDENGAVASKKRLELKLPSRVDPAIAEQLVEQARADGVDLVGGWACCVSWLSRSSKPDSRSRWTNISAMRNMQRRAVIAIVGDRWTRVALVPVSPGVHTWGKRIGASSPH